MENPHDSEWEAIRRVIAIEKSRAWADTAPIDPGNQSTGNRSPRNMIRLAAAAAALVLAVGIGLLIHRFPREKTMTLDELPFFATASRNPRATPLSPRERELGERLAGWMALAGKNPAAEVFPTGWLMNSAPAPTRRDVHGVTRKTMLECFFRAPDRNQEVES